MHSSQSTTYQQLQGDLLVPLKCTLLNLHCQGQPNLCKLKFEVYLAIAHGIYNYQITISFQEPGIARSLITNGVLQKDECLNTKTIKYQNFWKVKIPPGADGVITVPDKYELHEIPDTNIFIIIKYTSYTGGQLCQCGASMVCMLCHIYSTFQNQVAPKKHILDVNYNYYWYSI